MRSTKQLGSLSDCRSSVCKFESQLSHITLQEIDFEIISYCHSPTFADSRKTVVSY